MFRSILVPLDGSPFGEYAVPFALGIARRAGAAVQLVHVHVPVVQVTGITLLDIGADEKTRDGEKAYLDEVARTCTAAAPEVRVSTALLEGLGPEALCEQAGDGKADLIVMATHGRGPISRFWLGSVADTLVRTAPVPLLLIRPGEQPPKEAVAAPFRHVLIPLDGSPLAEQALKPALGLGRLMEARVTLLRVVQPGMMVGYAREWSGVIPTEEVATRQLVDDAHTYLEGVARRLGEQGLTAQTCVVLHPHPAAAILEEAGTLGADLIGLATHGRGGVKRLLLGSVADKVLRGATTPVLMYRPLVKA